MGISVDDTPRSDLDALAAMLSLPTDNLDRVDNARTRMGTMRPSGSWLADQAMLVARLPSGLLRPHAPLNWAVQASQMAKKVAMGVSGGGDTLAAKAAMEGVRLEAKLRPRAAPTVLCPAHRKLHPTLVREMFYYLTREVADRADPVRRHARRGDSESSSSSSSSSSRSRGGSGDQCKYAMCRSQAVRDWGNRMLGLCALWCDRSTFASLERGTLGASSCGSSSSSSNSSSSSSRSGSSRSSSSSRAAAAAATATATRRRIEGEQRMPHLELPCEVCVLAVVAAQSQALIDLQASMLSRMALEAHGRRRQWEKEKGKGERKERKNDCELMPKYYPHLWRVVQSWATAFGEEDAAEIRQRSQALAKELYVVRRCECRRRRWQDHRQQGRHHHYLHSKYQSGGGGGSGRPSRSSKGGRYDRCPARMATKYGHRLPLPLLPRSEDAWSWPDDFGGAAAKTRRETAGALRASRVYQSCGRSRSGSQAGQLQSGRREVAEEPAKWEEAYRRHVLESKSEMASILPTPVDDDDDDDDDGHDEQASFVTVTAHTEATARRAARASSTLLPVPVPPSSLVPPPLRMASSAYSRVTACSKPTAGRDGVCSHVPQHVTARQQPQQQPQRQQRQKAPQAPSTRQSTSRPTPPETTFRPPAGVRKPATPASYVALQADVTASFGMGGRGKEKEERGARVKAEPGPLPKQLRQSGLTRASAGSGAAASTVLPDDSISCVLERRQQRETREREREREWEERRERRREREERQRQRERERAHGSSSRSTASISKPSSSHRPPHRDLPRQRQQPKMAPRAPTEAGTDCTARTRWPSGN